MFSSCTFPQATISSQSLEIFQTFPHKSSTKENHVNYMKANVSVIDLELRQISDNRYIEVECYGPVISPGRAASITGTAQCSINIKRCYS
jgi:hypothetical protein